MRFADFAVDLAAVLSASRSVASKHFALRARQLDRYSKTSSIAAALRQQRPRGRPDNEKAARDEAPRSDAASEEAPAERHDAGVKAGGASRGALSNSSQLSSSNPWQGISHALSAKSPFNIPEQTNQDSWPVLQKLRRQQAGDTPDAELTTKSKFKPAYWANMSPAVLSQVKPRHPPPIVDAPLRDAQAGEAEEEVPEGVNINIFHTSRGSGLVERLKKAEDETPRQPPPQNLTSTTPDAPEESISPSPANSGPSSVPDQTQIPPSTEQPLVSSAPELRRAASAAAEKQMTEEDLSAIGGLAAEAATPAYHLRESKVPSSRISRLWNYGGLAAGMLGGALTESISRAAGGGGSGSLMLSAGNMERLVAKLSRMRGAALKLGQMMSFQDSKMLPAPIQEVLQRVQDRADYMPAWQRDRVLSSNLGPEWRDLFETFEEKPMAAASIGQVHRATLKSNGAQVAVKIQFPGVADSINSDLDNLGILLAATKLLPKGLYLNKTIDNARLELGWECDYEREAQCAQRYHELLSEERDVFAVPTIYPEACGKQVLTMEYMEGTGVTRVKSFTQEQRDWIGTQILRLCLREITEFRFMQTDPNWTNFLYNADKNKLELLDFGASREYPERFVTLYVQLLAAASRGEREGVKTLSEGLGYLTGHESKAMLDAHIQSVLTLAEPFLDSAPEVYDFQDQTITERVKALIPVMIRERLAPPPEETYSLHRKLSGAFLLCARLGSRVRCRELFGQSLQKISLLTEKV